MQFCYFVAGLDRESFELLISLAEIPVLEDHEHHFDASVVETTLDRISKECDEFIEGLSDHGGDGFGLELLYNERAGTVGGEHRPICELCLVDGPMNRFEAVLRLNDIKSTAEFYVDELQESTLELLPTGKRVNWKVEGF